MVWRTEDLFLCLQRSLPSPCIYLSSPTVSQEHSPPPPSWVVSCLDYLYQLGFFDCEHRKRPAKQDGDGKLRSQEASARMAAGGWGGSGVLRSRLSWNPPLACICPPPTPFPTDVSLVRIPSGERAGPTRLHAVGDSMSFSKRGWAGALSPDKEEMDSGKAGASCPLSAVARTPWVLN